MTREDLWSRLDHAVSISDRKKAKDATVALLQQAYQEDLTFMCAAVSAPEEAHTCNALFVHLEDRRYFAVFTKVKYFNLFRSVYENVYNPQLLGMWSRTVLDDVLDRENVQGIVFNPTGVRTGLVIQKADLTFGAQREQYSAFQSADRINGRNQQIEGIHRAT